MQTVVAKFGGTSVANAKAMNHCADIVIADNNIRLVVLSASASVTNLLILLAHGSELAERRMLLAEVKSIQYAILSELKHPTRLKSEIDQLLDNIAILSEAASLATSAILTDELVSHGELMSSLLFTEILREQHYDVEWFDIRKVMRTDDAFGKATPDLAVLSDLCQKYLMPHLREKVIITQGFIGRDAQGKTTTLGRGGSDYTAALLGEALKVDRVDIWTDVDGIYTTDPRIVPTAQRIEEISFAEATEMAIFGAKILHPATLLPAVRCNIPVFVGSSQKPLAGGTLVCHESVQPPLFRALALRRQQTLLKLHRLNMSQIHDFLATIFNILANHQISIDVITSSEMSVALVLDTQGASTNGNYVLTSQLLADLTHYCRVEIEENLALITLIGHGLVKVKGIGKMVFGVLDRFNLRLMSSGASNHNLCLLVPNQEAEAVLNTLHKTLFDVVDDRWQRTVI